MAGVVAGEGEVVAGVDVSRIDGHGLAQPLDSAVVLPAMPGDQAEVVTCDGILRTGAR